MSIFMNCLKSNNFFHHIKDEFETPKIIKKCLASFYILLIIYIYFFVIYKDGSLEVSKI